jgi:hypothetical protein
MVERPWSREIGRQRGGRLNLLALLLGAGLGACAAAELPLPISDTCIAPAGRGEGSHEASTFTMLGEIMTPGRHEYVEGMTLMDAVDMAGGLTVHGSPYQVLVTRAGASETARCRLPNESERIVTILPGDVIRVLPRE